MNEDLQNALAELVNKATSGAEQAGEFLASELPEVVEQLLMWYAVKSALLCLLSIIILWSCVRFVKKAKDYVNDSSIDPHGTGVPIYLVSGGIHFVAFLVAILELFNLQWLQIWIAPKIWLIEYAAKLAS